MTANKTQLKRLSAVRKGIWWWADDKDNPFGYAILACPRISRVKNLTSMVYLYNLTEAVDWAYPKMIARERSPYKISRLGWVIYYHKNCTKWTLPDRFVPDVTAKLVRKNIIEYNRLIER